MYCGKCGNLLDQNDKFCGKCGATNTEVLYVEEQQLEPKLDNMGVVALTVSVLVLTILIIVCISVVTKDIPVTNQLYNMINNVLI